MKEIKLTQGKVALVDDEDYDYLNQWKWYALKNYNTYYARRGFYLKGKHTSITMHSLIMKPPFGMVVDHIDHNGLNNQKHNMRNCTVSQNCMNRKSAGSSKYLGVSKDKKCRKYTRKSGIVSTYNLVYYRAYITSSNKVYYLGSFKSEIKAARVYDKAAKKYHGEFANLNFK